MSIETVDKFWRSIAAVRDSIMESVRPVRGKVTSVSGGLVQLVRSVNEDTDPDLAEYSRIKGFKLTANDEVYALNLDGQQLLILGQLQNSTPSAFTLENALTVEGAITATSTIAGTGITGTSFNSPLFQTDAQSASDAASTTSTAVYSTALTTSIALGTGTWTVYALGGLHLTHSAGSTANMLIQIDSEDGTARSLSPDATVYTHFVSEHIKAGCTGTINVLVRFKSSAAGTTAARNPWIIIAARRTA